MADAITDCSPFAPHTADGLPRSFDPKWRTETVRTLAKAIEAEAAFDRLPILADALEEAGCDDVELLRHCRECERHKSGCWVLWYARGSITTAEAEYLFREKDRRENLLLAHSNAALRHTRSEYGESLKKLFPVVIAFMAVVLALGILAMAFGI